MARYRFDFPFYVPLDEGAYRLNAAGLQVGLEHSVVERTDLDPRLGGLSGSFGLERDQLGVLRYSRLTLDLSQPELEHLGAVFFGDVRSDTGPGEHEGRGRVALAACNSFLERYRVATRKADIQPLGPWDLALVHFENGHASGDIRLYGGGITAPPAGLSPEYHERVLARLADPEPPAPFEVAAVDALQSVADGRALEAIATAMAALEAALDLYFTRSWRLRNPPLAPRAAAAEVGVRDPSDVYTIEDVLEKAGVRAKARAYGTATGLGEAERDGLSDAIAVRNLAVHGGVRLPPGTARPYVETLARFVLDQLAPAVRRECPTLPRAESLYACEEALGVGCTPEPQRLADAYLTDRGLAGRLFNHRFERRRMESERFGDTLVVRVSFRDFDPEDVALFIARAVLHHALERRGGRSPTRRPVALRGGAPLLAAGRLRADADGVGGSDRSSPRPVRLRTARPTGRGATGRGSTG